MITIGSPGFTIITVRNPIGRAIGSDLKGNLSLALYASGTVVAFIAPVVSYFFYGAVAVMWFVPDRRLASPAGSE